MNRRELLKTAATGAIALTFGSRMAHAKEYFPVPVHEKLFKGINRAKNVKAETELEKLHVPVIKAPEKVKAGDVFPVTVSIGRILHVMNLSHWIEYIQLNIGNEPAGTLHMQPQGYMIPEARFDLKLGDTLKGTTVSLVVQEKCNLHGIWESNVNVAVV